MADDAGSQESLKELPPESTKSREWLLLNGVRQMLSVAQRAQATYADAVSMTADLAPTLLPADSEFVEALESALERLYRARAAAQSASTNAQVLPVQVLEADIEQLSAELESVPDDRSWEIARQLERLRRARERLSTKRTTEAQVIRRDTDSFGLGRNLPISGQGDRYKDYQFQPGRVLRVRILHPDPPEWKTGVDLIYESYWSKRHRSKGGCRRYHAVVRLAALQYKMWDGKRLYTSDPRIIKQLDRAEAAFCSRRLCATPARSRRRYGLPYCGAFLRPTDLRQRATGFAVSHAWHVPVCEVKRQMKRDAKKLESKYLSSSSVSQTVFSELFNRNMLGTKWIKIGTLEAIYKQTGVLDSDDRVVIHAQEYGD